MRVRAGVGLKIVTLVLIVAELFPSSLSGTRFSWSTVAVFSAVVSTMAARRPVMVTTATAAAPVPSDPRSQSSVPPVTASRSEHTPRVVLKLVYVKFGGGRSTKPTVEAGALPMFRTSMV